MKETQLVPTVETILSLMEMISTALWCVCVVCVSVWVCAGVCVCVCGCHCVCAELVRCFIHDDLHDNHVYTIAHPFPWECLLLTLTQ